MSYCDTCIHHDVCGVDDEATTYCADRIEPCDDAISRQAVLDLPRIKTHNEWGNIIKESVDVENVRQLPPVNPQPKWIPVSEGLPTEDGEYLLFGKIDEDEENYIFIGEYDSCGEQFGIWQEQFDRETLGCLGSEFFDYSSVIAWMPLPAPYEPQESEEGE